MRSNFFDLIAAHSYFSLKYGTLSPKQLVTIYKAIGMDTAVLTDINNTTAAFEFIQEAHRQGIKPVIGVEFRRGDKYLYTAIAKNNEGLKEINALLSEVAVDGLELDIVAPRFHSVYVIYRPAFLKHKKAKTLSSFYEHEYIGIRPEEIHRLYGSELINYMNKLVVYSPITFIDKEGYNLHRILRCIDLNIIIGKLEEINCAKSSEIPIPLDEFIVKYEKYPQIVYNSLELLENCGVHMISTYLHNRRCFTKSTIDDFKLLTKLALNGCYRRYGKNNSAAIQRTKKELKVINELGFCAYFLITWDIIRYAGSSGYHHVGRGSGANSIVAFNLSITDVDPLELDLYFERFLNPHRSSPPDFDIDFSWDQRDDVVDYIFKRYGKEYTALLATYNTFKGKSIIRELGKVFALPKHDIDTIVHYPNDASRHHAFAKHIFYYGEMMEGFPNYLSIHAGGILISERSLYYHGSLQLMPKGFPIIMFDMYAAEDLQFHKYDILSQRGLGHIKDAVEIIGQNKGESIDIHDVHRIKEDRNVLNQLSSGKCIGCFYVESPAMRGLITKLKCDNYIGLVAASSIIRPGVAKSGMMREYIKRHHDPSSFKYIHSTFEKHLSETYGVMVYQEDVMKIVHHFADLDLDESDVLRRIMTGKKKKSETFKRLQDKFFANCKKKGYDTNLTMEVWRQIESFSGYSFSKAHSASYAVESFQSLYLKTYFPLEFMVAVINNFGGFYSTELYFHEARMAGAIIEAPCVNHSAYLTSIDDKTIYVGFVHIESLEQKIARSIVKEREENGEYASLYDFVNRIDIGKVQLQLLIRIGAFRFAKLNKYELMWEKNAVHRPEIKHNGTGQLFQEAKTDYKLPILDEDKHEQAFDEIELLGFPLCNPFDLLVTDFRGDILAKDMTAFMGRRVRMLGYFITRKYVRTVNGRLMNFGTFIDYHGDFFDSVHFPPSLKKYSFQGSGIYIMLGKIVEDFDFPSIEVYRMEKMPYVKDGRY